MIKNSDLFGSIRGKLLESALGRATVTQEPQRKIVLRELKLKKGRDLAGACRWFSRFIPPSPLFPEFLLNGDMGCSNARVLQARSYLFLSTMARLPLVAFLALTLSLAARAAVSWSYSNCGLYTFASFGPA